MLAQILVDTAQRFPDETGLIYDDQSWTWEELQDRVARLAAGLGKAGIGPGDEVGIWLSNSPCFLLSYFAVLMRGAVVVPCNPAIKQGDCPPRIKALRTIITSRDLESSCRSATGTAEKRDSTQYLVCPDPNRCFAWSLIGEEQASLMPREEELPAMLQFSSGTTGLPKPLYRTNGQCLAEVRHFRDTCGMTSDDVVFGALPLFHAHGLANTLWAAVGSGARLVLMKEPQPFGLQWMRALQLLEKERVTVFPGVPMMFKTLAEAPIESIDLTRLRLCFSAGNPLPRSVFNKFQEKFQIPVRQLYGCTEAGSVTINMDSDAEAGAESVGYPMEGIVVEVRDESGSRVPPGEEGEVSLSSAAATSRYEGDGGENERFREGWFHTGDLGRFDADGRLHIIGRKAFMLTVAGHKVNAREVEMVLQLHPQVAEAAVVGVPDKKLGERIRAFVVGIGKVTDDDLIDHCRAQLPDFKQPQEYVFKTELPKTSLGKVAKDKLGE